MRYGSAILMVSIILSTMFLKQHSVFDVITGIVLSVFMYTVVYAKSPVHVGNSETSLEERISIWYYLESIKPEKAAIYETDRCFFWFVCYCSLRDQ